jgi:hypothetical protein
MDTKQILNKKRRGDIVAVADIIGESYENTRKILKREKSKKHSKAIKALANIIDYREKLKEAAQQS